MAGAQEKEEKVLVKITNHCTMNCSHCMDSAGPDGEHMSLDTYMAVLDWLLQVDRFRFIMIGGGEPTDHPDWLTIVLEANLRGFKVLVLSNGLFTLDPKSHPFLAVPGIMWQFTNDSRYYPTHVPDIPGHEIERHIRSMSPMGRAKENHLPLSRISPHCFNLRSINKTLRNFWMSIGYLRAKEKFCTPHVDIHGNIRAGESSMCHIIGTIHSTPDELSKELFGMKCNKCGLEYELTEEAMYVLHGKGRENDQI